MSVEELAAFADQALAGLEHRCVDFDLVDAAEPLRAGFEAKGWKAERLLWMRHEAPLPPGPEIVASRRFPTTPWTTCASPGASRTSRAWIQATTTPTRARSHSAAARRSWPCGRTVRRWPSPSSSATVRRPRSPTSTSIRSTAAPGAGRHHPRRDRGGGRRPRPLDHRGRRGPPEGALCPARLSPGLGDDGVPAPSINGCILRTARRIGLLLVSVPLDPAKPPAAVGRPHAAHRSGEVGDAAVGRLEQDRSEGERLDLDVDVPW